MVDVDTRRMGGLTPTASHAAALRRLSTRAATAAPAPRDALLPLHPSASALLSDLRSSGVPVLPGLSPAELARAEAELGLTLPPDLRAVLSLGVPSSPGFPDWRHPSHLRASLQSPLAAASLHLSRRYHSTSSGERSLRTARAALRRAPQLIPLFDRCYLPARPLLAGNPVFFVDESGIQCCALDLADFFRREIASAASASSFGSPSPLRRLRSASAADEFPPPPPPPPSRRSLDSVAGRTPRWIEFWSEAASYPRRRRLSSSSSSSTPPSPSPDRFVEIRPLRTMPVWVGGYLDRIGSVLRSGGWGESDVTEIIHVSASGILDTGDAGPLVDSQAIRDALVLKADRCSDSLRQAGWSPEEVHDALGFEFRRWSSRPQVNLPPEMALKLERLAKAVSRS